MEWLKYILSHWLLAMEKRGYKYMSNLKNCKSCGKIFNYIAGKPICPACRQAEEEKFQQVKEFIRENKQAGVDEICEKCDVDVPLVRQWIREEKLLFADDSPIGIDCEGCGTMIKTGRYCEKCKNELARGLTAFNKKDEPKRIIEPEKKPFNRMRFLQ